jgi:hypothetical protein
MKALTILAALLASATPASARGKPCREKGPEELEEPPPSATPQKSP